MDVSMNREKVDLYFKAWLEYDLTLLREIFTGEAKYIIENKNQVYEGIKEISRYWTRNKKRQKDIKLKWRTNSDNGVFFRARFWDSEECELQVIVGVIYFTFDMSGRICELREYYYKTVQDAYNTVKPCRMKRRRIAQIKGKV